ncbi:membrane protein [Paenibacillus baekrokdamisoli]|uniref:Membrane protein n=1 Tax=Paenibacillus baekrokdamisoli TaxID=1712516 RepID=A0A3G9J618_9BACL|nr:YggT family protein [Paenibacillus baekrokdamisoli]MBB3070195.1 uncharacterized protein YggT (Ycf19 family) [Paenibacillus baekrokdamisoli]BBH21201.1 membrane protein [Paenibacillus baekrokdamisoli]
MTDSVSTIISTLTTIYTYLILGYVLLSWLPSVRESFVGELLGKIVEPYLSPFRRIIPPIGGMLDISPIVALIALRYVARGIDFIVHLFI